MSQTLNSKSWKTTVAGITAIVIAVAGAVQLLVDTDPKTNPDWNALVAAVMAGFGLIFARDNDKTSEEVGANVEKLRSPKDTE